MEKTLGNASDHELSFVVESMSDVEELLASHCDISTGSDLFSLIESFDGYMPASAIDRLHEMRLIRNQMVHYGRSIKAARLKGRRYRRIRSLKDFKKALAFVKSEIVPAARRRLRIQEMEKAQSSGGWPAYCLKIPVRAFRYVFVLPFVLLFTRPVGE